MFVMAAAAATGEAPPPDQKAKPTQGKRTGTSTRIVYDHLKTGFELLGFHKQVKCEECHIKGVFRGTPRECATCHAVGSRFLTATTMSPKHFQVGNKACDDCHVTSDWNSVNVHHDSGMLGKCNSCHDGTHASGEPANHFPTQQASCDYCHSTYTWLKASFNHAFLVQAVPGTSSNPACNSCHNGSKAQGAISPPHIPINGQDCIVCHRNPPAGQVQLGNDYTQLWQMGATFRHADYAITNCANCHNNVLEVGKGGDHINTSQDCKLCHKTTSDVRSGSSRLGDGLGFAGAQMDHTGISGACATCHAVTSKSSIQGIQGLVDHGPAPTDNLVVKVANHVTTTLACETCHAASNFTTFSGTAMNHTGITTGCKACHGTSDANVQYNASVLGATHNGSHIPTSQVADVCETCHTTTTPGGFASAAMSHQGVTGNCSSCHENPSFNPAINFAGLTTQDYGTGSAKILVVRPLAQIASGPNRGYDHPVTGDCSGCHASFTTFLVAIAGKGMPTGHFPTTQSCTLCHGAGYGTGLSVMNHTGSGATCNTCHGVTFSTTINGVAGTAFIPVSMTSAGVSHIPTTGADCSVCHKAGAPTVPVNSAVPAYAAGGAFRVTSYISDLHSYVSTTTCSSCHGGANTYTGMVNVGTIAAAVGSLTTQPATITGCSAGSGTHGALGECTNCHQSKVIPSTATTGFCSVGLPAGHFATTQACSLCHAGGYALNSTKMDHTGITTCNACHSGQTFTVAGVSVTPVSSTTSGVTHMPFTASADCAVCHTAAAPTVTVSTSTPGYTAGGSFRVASYVSTLHNYVTTGTCATCHDSGGTAYTGLAKIQTIAAAVGSITSTPTTIAGCTANAGTTHPAAGGVCNTCHTSTVMPSTATTGFCGASLLPSNHFAVSGSCDLCHAKGYTLGTSVMDHSGVSLTSCIPCHSGSMTIKSSTFTPVTVSSVSHIPLASGTSSDCMNCHTASNIPTKVVNATQTYSAGGGFKVTSYVANLHNYVNAGDCTACHDNKSFTGMAPVTRVPATLGLIASTPSTIQGCTTSGGAHGALGACSNCHYSSAIVVPGGPSTGFCAATGVAPSGHIPFTGACSACHSGGTTLGTTVMNHSAASNVCTTCHGMSSPISFPAGGGTTPVAGGATHIPVSSTTCSNCHGTAPATVLVTSSTQNLGRFKMTTYPSSLHSFVSTATCGGCHGGTLFNGITGTQGTQGAAVGRIVIMPANVTDCSKGNGPHPTTTGDCAGCHFQPNIPATPTTGFCSAASMPNNHVPNPANLACSICHAPGAATGPLGLGTTGVMVHTGISTGCANCHNGQTFAGVNPVNKNTHPTHIPTTQACELCHYNNVFTIGTGFKIPASKMSHTGIAANTCNTCHGGSANAYYGITTVVKPAYTGHSLYEMATSQCDVCHTGGTATGGFKVKGTASYHKTYKPADSTCRSCHASSTTWSGATVESVGTKSHNSPTNCSSAGSCHKPTGRTGTAFSSWD
jgi:hypothetical protein